MIPWFLIKIFHTLKNSKNLYHRSDNQFHKVDYIHIKSRGVLRTQSDIEDETFNCHLILQKALSYICGSVFNRPLKSLPSLPISCWTTMDERWICEERWTDFSENSPKTYMRRAILFTLDHFFFLVCLLTFSFCPHLQQMNLGNTNYIFSFPFDFRHFWHTSTLFTDHFHRVIIVWSYYCVKWNRFRSGVFIINFEHISQLVLLFLLLILDR